MKRRKFLLKIEKGKKLTRKEDMFYLTGIIGFSLHEARVIFAITANKKPTIIID